MSRVHGFNFYILIAIVVLSLIGCQKKDSEVQISPDAKYINQDKEAPSAEEPKKFVKYDSHMIAGEAIDVSFTQINASDLFLSIKKHFDIKKSEYESTKEFQGRVDKLKGLPYYNDLIFSDVLAFRVNIEKNGRLDYAYNADTEQASISTGLILVPLFEWESELSKFGKPLPKWLTVFPLEQSSSRSTAIGMTSAGIKSDVDVVRALRFGLASAKIPLLKFSGNEPPRPSGEPMIKFKVAKSIAKEYLSNLEAVVIFQLLDPYIAQNGYSTDATMSNPNTYSTIDLYLYGSVKGIVIYNRTDGKIIHRLPNGFGLRLGK